MGCQRTTCRGCGGTYKACQLVGGLCQKCRVTANPPAPEQTTPIISQQDTAPAVTNEVNQTNDVYYT